MFEIDWTTDEDRRRRRYKASTIHGWLRMWRGTLAGNEQVRQQGRREMKEARARRAYRRQHPGVAGGNSSPFSFLLGGFGNRRNGATATPAPKRHISSSSRHHNSHHRSGSRSQNPQRPTPTQRKGSTGTNTGPHHTRQGHAPPRPEPKRNRSSHSAKCKPKTSRQSSGRR